MNVHLEKDARGCSPEGTTVLTLHCEREDAAMVYFALREYSDKLVKSLKKAKELDWEDKMFLHESLYKINHLLFEILDNHPKAEALEIRQWLDVI